MQKMGSLVKLPGVVTGGLLFLLLLSSASTANGGVVSSNALNIIDFGAVADGQTDASKALLASWSAACAADVGATVLVPPGTFLVGPMKLQGPCKGPVVFRLEGLVRAPADLSAFADDYWICFEGIDGLTVTGGGTFDGQGASAWGQDSCDELPGCKTLPNSVRFKSVTHATVQGISSIDSKFFHLQVLDSSEINLQSLNITAPKDSPNTDGVHISRSSGVTVVDSVIRTGDDCVSIGPGSTNLNISNITCGPGHGISVGSLGKYLDEGDVSNVMVRNCTISDTENGVRIKTWRSSYASSAHNITFQDIVTINAAHPIIIDQEYCPHGSCDGKPPSQVSISHVNFWNIKGTSASKVAVSLNCSQAVPCQNVDLQDIELETVDGDKSTESECSNVQPTFTGMMIPPACRM